MHEVSSLCGSDKESECCIYYAVLDQNNAGHYLVITIYLYLESRRDGHLIRYGALYDILMSIYILYLPGK